MASDLDLKLLEDIKEIKVQLIELIKVCSAMAETIKEHERRSTNLENRIKPIENSYVFVLKLQSAIISLGGLIGLILGLRALFH